MPLDGLCPTLDGHKYHRAMAEFNRGDLVVPCRAIHSNLHQALSNAVVGPCDYSATKIGGKVMEVLDSQTCWFPELKKYGRNMGWLFVDPVNTKYPK